MDICQRGVESVDLGNVAIVSAAWLPETSSSSWPLLDGYPREPLGSMNFQPSNRVAGDSFFDFPLKATNVDVRLTWCNQ